MSLRQDLFLHNFFASINCVSTAIIVSIFLRISILVLCTLNLLGWHSLLLSHCYFLRPSCWFCTDKCSFRCSLYWLESFDWLLFIKLLINCNDKWTSVTTIYQVWSIEHTYCNTMNSLSKNQSPLASDSRAHPWKRATPSALSKARSPWTSLHSRYTPTWANSR